MDKRADLLIVLAVLVSAPLYYLFADQLPQVRMGDPIGADGMPKLLAIGLFLTGLWMLAMQVRRWRATKGWIVPDEGEEDEAGFPVSTRRVAIFMMGMMAYVYLIEPLGTLIATVLFVSGGLLVYGERRWTVILSTAVGLTAVTYLIYGVLLGVGLPAGPLRGS